MSKQENDTQRQEPNFAGTPVARGTRGSHRTLRLVEPPMTGPDVRTLQESLRRRGLILDANGVYDRRTQFAVKAFQEHEGLRIDGVVDQGTWDAVLRSRKAAEGPEKTAETAAPAASQSLTAEKTAEKTPEAIARDMADAMGTPKGGWAEAVALAAHNYGQRFADRAKAAGEGQAPLTAPLTAPVQAAQAADTPVTPKAPQQELSMAKAHPAATGFGPTAAAETRGTASDEKAALKAAATTGTPLRSEPLTTKAAAGKTATAQSPAEKTMAPARAQRTPEFDGVSNLAIEQMRDRLRLEVRKAAQVAIYETLDTASRLRTIKRTKGRAAFGLVVAGAAFGWQQAISFFETATPSAWAGPLGDAGLALQKALAMMPEWSGTALGGVVVLGLAYAFVELMKRDSEFD